MTDLQAVVDGLRDGETWVAPPLAKFEPEAPIDLRGKRWLTLDLSGATIVTRHGGFANAGVGCRVRRGNFTAPDVDVRHAAAEHAREVVAAREAKAATMLALLLSLGGCAGHGPLGTDLGLVDGTISVTDPQGNTCNVKVTNGKDQTNLELEGLHVCGASIDKLHADRSDGAQAAINANADVAKTLGGQLIGLLGSAISMLGVPTGPHGPHSPPAPTKPVPPVVIVPPPPPPPPGGHPSLMMLEAPDL